MGGIIFDDNEFDFDILNSPSNETADDHRTFVLVGRTGNGKSATANSILGRKAFISRSSSSGVTQKSQLHQTRFTDGQIITVIDTPGLFDCSLDHGFIGSEIVKCFQMAPAGVHAILMVFSIRTRFSKEEEDAIHCLKAFFGEKIFDYMIVVFTGGDELDDEEEDIAVSFENYLGHECPESLQEILSQCNNRKVLFDNKTKDEDKKTLQQKKLFALVEEVMNLNGGQPYSDEIFQEIQRAAKEYRDEMERIKLLELEERRKACEEQQLKGITEMIEVKLNEETLTLQRELEKEKLQRLKAEKDSEELKFKFNNENEMVKHKSQLMEESRKAYEMQLKGITEMIEVKLNESTLRLQRELEKEKLARLNAEKDAKELECKFNNEMNGMRNDLNNARNELGNPRCTIM